MKKFQAENRLKQYSQIQQISVEKPTPLLLPRPVPFGMRLGRYVFSSLGRENQSYQRSGQHHQTSGGRRSLTVF